MTAKQWLIKCMLVTCVVIGLPVGGVMLINYMVDPLWNFNHENKWNAVQDGFDERQQKMNYMHAHEMDYDGVLIGTSRSTYMNASSFKDARIFNLALSNLHIDEYLSYLSYAQRLNNKPFEKIYIELTNNSYAMHLPQTAKPIAYYSEVTEGPFYRYKTLFSYATLERSLQNIAYTKEIPLTKPRLYQRNLDTFTHIPSYEEQAQLTHMLGNWTKRGEAYWFEYDEQYKEKLQAIKEAFPQAEIIPFNDLMPMSRLQATLDYQDRQLYYDRYVAEVVEVFGVFYSFHFENDTTRNYKENFLDLYHFYNHVGDEVIAALEDPQSSSIVGVKK